MLARQRFRKFYDFFFVCKFDRFPVKFPQQPSLLSLKKASKTARKSLLLELFFSSLRKSYCIEVLVGDVRAVYSCK